MKRIALLFLAALCSSTALVAQPAGSVPLRNPQSVVISLYGRISNERIADRRATYAQLPADLQEDLWTLHLTYFLADHPDLSMAEKALVFEALGLVGSGVMEVDPASAAWRTNTLAAVHDYEARATKIGSKALLDALTRLGGPDVAYPRAQAKGLRADWLPGDECECNTVGFNFCCWGDCPTSTTPECHRSGRPWCIPVHGCGVLWSEDCDGICGA